MFQSSSISLLAPQVNSSTAANPTRKPVAATKLNFASRSTRKSFTFLKNIDVVPVLAVAVVASLLFFLVMHVVWINVYSSKGFTLKTLQNSIDEQTTMQKKLLVQQSMLTSSLSLGEAGQNGLVPVTDVEHLTGNSLAQAK